MREYDIDIKRAITTVSSKDELFLNTDFYRFEINCKVKLNFLSIFAYLLLVDCLYEMRGSHKDGQEYFRLVEYDAVSSGT